MTSATQTMADDLPIEQPAQEPLTHEARCTECPARVTYQPTSNGGGFMVLAQSGVGIEQSFGIGPNGIPICPHGHGVMTIADDQLPAEDAFALAQEQLAATEPKAPRLPFPSPPFNYEGALHEIFEKQSDVTRLEIGFNDADDRRKKAKSALDEAREELGKMIEVIREREEERNAELERKQAQVDAGHPEDTNLVRCKWEEQHPGEACPICSDDDLQPDAARDSEAHVEEVAAVLDLRSAVVVADALEAFGIMLPVLTIQRWSEDERAAVKAWAEFDRSSTEAAPERPAVLGTSHVAAERRDGQAQCCTQCDAVLFAAPDGDQAQEFYSAGMLVGVDCPGKAKADGQHYIGGQRKGRRKKAETTEAAE